MIGRAFLAELVDCAGMIVGRFAFGAPLEGFEELVPCFGLLNSDGSVPRGRFVTGPRDEL